MRIRRGRELAGIGFPGVSAADVVSRTAHVTVPGAVVRPERAEMEVPGAGTFVLWTWHRTERGAYAMLPAGPDLLMVATMEWDSGAPASGEKSP
ncbi:hypothetical protein [Nonomuraea aurantiaca]|uniref:hypothetical protein n=1 Tax=Nonomuraea aurantiaca TaxID=2878562 RepID=UPI001CDA1D86|nr:hypothetical protein [Nonomuraea aurantiaca]MCA2229714.1 hypothetical protein [Nonomuraea aurantiaca]